MGRKDDFVHISLNANNVDNYYHRKSILKAIEHNSHRFKGKLLDAGCGKMPYKEFIFKHSEITGYTGLDIETALSYDDDIKPDVTWDGKTMPFEDAQFDCVMATEVLEHVPHPEVYLAEVFRVLKKGGGLFFTVPFLWPLHESPHDEYRYTPFAMKRLLTDAGFTDIQVKALGGWNASLGQMLGLWLKRGPMPRRVKKVVRFMALPIFKYLYSCDNTSVDFMQNTMITGLSGSALKEN